MQNDKRHVSRERLRQMEYDAREMAQSPEGRFHVYDQIAAEIEREKRDRGKTL